MRRLVVAMLVLGLSPALAADPYQTVLDWEEGTFLASTRLGIDTVDFWRAPFAVDACHRQVLLDLLYTPDTATASAPGVGDVSIVYEFLAEIWAPGGSSAITSRRISFSGYGHTLGILPDAGAYEIRLSLFTGANVSWDARLRARSLPSDPACLPQLLINEVEADPAGADAPWVELYNARTEAVDASGWILRWNETDSLTLPSPTSVAPHGRIVVTLPAGSLPTTDLVLTIASAFGMTTDTSPPLTDVSDDARTWQRIPDGGAAWAFTTGTQGATNG